MDIGLVIAYIAGFIVALLLGKTITSWYHEIEKRNRYLETQIKLLGQIAANQGVNIDKVSEIVAEARIPEKIKLK